MRVLQFSTTSCQLKSDQAQESTKRGGLEEVVNQFLWVR